MNMTKLTCREAAKLLFASLDTTDPSETELERLAVHLSKCEACRRVQSQGEFMRRAFSAWRKQSGVMPKDGPQRVVAAHEVADESASLPVDQQRTT